MGYAGKCFNGDDGSFQGFEAVSGALVTTGGTPHSGSYFYTCDPADYATLRTRNQGASGQTIGAKVWFKFNQAPSSDGYPIAELRPAGSNPWGIQVELTTNRYLQIRNYNGGSILYTGSTALATATYHALCIEIAVGTSTSTYKVWLNGTSVYNSSVGSGSATSFYAEFQCRGSIGSGMVVDFDDLVLTGWEALNSPTATWFVNTIRPNGTGTDSGDYSNTYTNIDDVPPDDGTERVCSNSSGSFTCATTGPTVTSAGVQNVGYRSKRGNGGSTTHYISWKTTSTKLSEITALDTAYLFFLVGTSLETVITQAQIDALEIGATIVGAQDHYISEVYFFLEYISGGTVKDVAGTVAGVSTVTANGVATKVVAGTVAGASTVTASAQATKPVTGTIAGVSSVTATAQKARNVSGTVAAVSTMTANAVVIRNVSGTIAGVSSVTATAGAIRNVSSAIDAVSTVTANAVLAPAVGAGTVAAVSTMTANAVGTFSVAGTVNAVSAMTVDAITIVTVDGLIAAVSTMTASAERIANIAGTIAAQSTMTASPVVLFSGAGTINAVSAMTVSATADKPVSGTIAAVSDVTASAVVVKVVSATVTAVSTMTAVAEALRYVAGTIAGVSTVTASATATKPVAGTVSAVSSMTANAVAIRNVSGTVSAASGMTASATRLIFVSGAVNAVSGMSVLAIRFANVSGQVNAVSSMTASGTRTRNVTGTIAGVSDMTCSAVAFLAAPRRRTTTTMIHQVFS